MIISNQNITFTSRSALVPGKQGGVAADSDGGGDVDSAEETGKLTLDSDLGIENTDGLDAELENDREAEGRSRNVFGNDRGVLLESRND